MIINEIEIHTKQCPNYDDIENLFVKILELDSNDLLVEYTMMDDWCYTNEKRILKINLEDLKNKIYSIEFYKNSNSKGIIQIEKVKEIYHINMYIRDNIIDKLNMCLIEKIKNIIYSFEFIAFGDDFFIGEGKNTVLSSSGVELWVFPLDSNEMIINKINLLEKD